jgi:hypothetical protein
MTWRAHSVCCLQHHLENPMTRKSVAIALLVPFAVLSAYAVYKVGYVGVIDYQLHSPAGWQVFADLVIACVLLLMWIIPDARKRGRNPWGYVLITVLAGAFGPLLYWALGKPEQ